MLLIAVSADAVVVSAALSADIAAVGAAAAAGVAARAGENVPHTYLGPNTPVKDDSTKVWPGQRGHTKSRPISSLHRPRAPTARQSLDTSGEMWTTGVRMRHGRLRSWQKILLFPLQFQWSLNKIELWTAIPAAKI